MVGDRGSFRELRCPEAVVVEIAGNDRRHIASRSCERARDNRALKRAIAETEVNAFGCDQIWDGVAVDVADGNRGGVDELALDRAGKPAGWGPGRRRV